MAFTFAALASEINNDPQTYGFAAFVQAGNDQAITDALNKVRDGTDGEAAQIVKRPNITGGEILEAIDRADFSANPNPALVAYFESATQQASVRLVDEAGADTRILSNIKGLLSASTASRTRLNAIAEEPGSRAQKLFGYSVRITNADVATALGRG